MAPFLSSVFLLSSPLCGGGGAGASGCGMIRPGILGWCVICKRLLAAWGVDTEGRGCCC